LRHYRLRRAACPYMTAQYLASFAQDIFA